MCICWCVTEINCTMHGATVKIIKWKLHTRRNEDDIVPRQCLLLFGTLAFFFLFAIQQFGDGRVQNHNFVVVFCGCETWSVTLRERHRLKVFENRVLRKIFKPKRDEITGERRKLRRVELNDLYFPPIIIRVTKSRRMRWAGHVARVGEEKWCRVLARETLRRETVLKSEALIGGWY